MIAYYEQSGDLRIVVEIQLKLAQLIEVLGDS
jgi:hypothetical protein